MEPKTLEALQESIEKWEEILNNGGVDDGRHDCSLCKLFWEDNDCQDCPINDKTKKNYCEGSPYPHWHKHQKTKHKATIGKRPIHCPHCKELAEKELEFLKSLLPKGE